MARRWMEEPALRCALIAPGGCDSRGQVLAVALLFFASSWAIHSMRGLLLVPSALSLGGRCGPPIIPYRTAMEWSAATALNPGLFGKHLPMSLDRNGQATNGVDCLHFR